MADGRESTTQAQKLEKVQSAGRSKSESIWTEVYKKWHVELENHSDIGNDETTTLQDLKSELSKAQDTAKGRPIARAYERISPLVTWLQQYNELLDVFSRSHPVFLLVWGAMKTIIQVGSKYKDMLDDITKNIADFTKHLPRFDIYLKVFPDSPRLEIALANLYSELIEFCFSSIHVLRKNTFISQKVSSRTTSNDPANIESCSNDIEKAFVASVRANMNAFSNIQSALEENARPNSTPNPSIDKIHVIPFPQNGRFQGRKDDIEEIHATVDSAQRFRLPRTLTVTGIGGVGKTQTTLEYVHSHLDAFDAVFWAPADTVIKLNQAFALFAGALGLVDKRAVSSVDMVREMARKNSSIAILPFWPSGEYGSVIVTSRLGKAFANPTKRKHQLHFLSAEVSLDLFLSQLREGGYAVDENNRASARELVRELGGLPLAITHIVGTMLSIKCDLEEMCDIFRKRKHSELLCEETPDGIDCFYEHSMTDGRDATFSKFDGITSRLLAVNDFLDSDNINEQLFKAKGAACAELPGMEFLGPITKVYRIIPSLSTFVLIERSVKEKTISVHRLVPASLLQKMEASKWLKTFDISVDLLHHHFPPQALGIPLHKVHGTCDMFLPHVLRLSQHYNGAALPPDSSERLGDLLRNASWYMFERGWFQQVFPVLEPALNIYADVAPKDSLGHCLILNTYGSVYTELSEPSKAFSYFSGVKNLREMRLELTVLGLTLKA